MRIFQAETPEQIEQARTLFREYESWLAVDLCFQGFKQELAALPGKYAPPDGRLLLATIEGKLAGCAALRRIDSETCEMKRLFVRHDFRGFGLGKRLIATLIEEARKIGYGKMRLDTLPERMPEALRLYRAVGFEEIDPYYDTPFAETKFLEFKLR